MRRQTLFVFLLVILALAIGFVMENLKVNLNYIIETGETIPGFFEQTPETKKSWIDSYKVDAPYDYYYNHQPIESLYTFSHRELVALKWAVTLVFVAIFMVINAWLMKLLTQKWTFVKWTCWMYAVFFGFSFAVFLVGKLTGTYEQAYGVSRKIVGGLQSLVPVMILFPASWLIQLKDQKATKS